MWKNHKGFTLLETSIALTVLFITISVSLPIMSLLQTERAIIKERRIIAYRLHDELLFSIGHGEVPMDKAFEIDNKLITISQTREDKLITSCARWENRKQRREEICLYGWHTPIE